MLLTVDQVAHELGGVSPGLVRKQVRLGALPAVKVGRCVRIDPRDLAVYVERCKSGPCSTNAAGFGGSTSSTSGKRSKGRRASLAPAEAKIERELLAELKRSELSTGKRTLRLLRGVE